MDEPEHDKPPEETDVRARTYSELLKSVYHDRIKVLDVAGELQSIDWRPYNWAAPTDSASLVKLEIGSTNRHLLDYILREQVRTLVPVITFQPHERTYRHVPPRGGAFSAVAKTVWVLWGDNVEKVWDVLRRWSTGGDVLKAACDEIIGVGFEEGRLYPEDSFRKILDWLSGDSFDYTQAAANLLPSIMPAIPRESLSEMASGWTPDEVGKSISGFCQAMEHIFYRDAAWTLKTFHQWARTRQTIYDDLISGTLERVVLPTNGTSGYYSVIEKQSLALQVLLGKGHAGKAAASLVKKARDCRSRATNEAAGRKRAGADATPGRRRKKDA